MVYSATATPNPDGPRDGDAPLEYRVDVDVSWEASGVRRARRYETILLREIPFGERLRRRFVEPKGNGLPAGSLRGSTK